MARGYKTGGRQKGVTNKATAELKDMLLTALSEAGGKDYLLRQAYENPPAFLTLLGKILPRDVTASVDTKTEVKFVNEFE